MKARSTEATVQSPRAGKEPGWDLLPGPCSCDASAPLPGSRAGVLAPLLGHHPPKCPFCTLHALSESRVVPSPAQSQVTCHLLLQKAHSSQSRGGSCPSPCPEATAPPGVGWLCYVHCTLASQSMRELSFSAEVTPDPVPTCIQPKSGRSGMGLGREENPRTNPLGSGAEGCLVTTVPTIWPRAGLMLSKCTELGNARGC